jgi:glutamate dehydrogenase (NAD(P)+)
MTGKRLAPAEAELIARGPDEEDLVNSGLEETMIHAYQAVRNEWVTRKGKVDMRTAAMIVAIDKVALSYEQGGIFP